MPSPSDPCTVLAAGHDKVIFGDGAHDPFQLGLGHVSDGEAAIALNEGTNIQDHLLLDDPRALPNTPVFVVLAILESLVNYQDGEWTYVLVKAMST